MDKKTTMNLFEIYDYIESLEKRVKKLERICRKRSKNKSK